MHNIQEKVLVDTMDLVAEKLAAKMATKLMKEKNQKSHKK